MSTKSRVVKSGNPAGYSVSFEQFHTRFYCDSMKILLKKLSCLNNSCFSGINVAIHPIYVYYIHTDDVILKHCLTYKLNRLL